MDYLAKHIWRQLDGIENSIGFLYKNIKRSNMRINTLEFFISMLIAHGIITEVRLSKMSKKEERICD